MRCLVFQVEFWNVWALDPNHKVLLQMAYLVIHPILP